MLRTILSAIAATLVGFFVIAIFEMIGHQIVPPPEGLDPTDAESIKAHMDQISVAALLLIWLSYIAGSFVAGAISAILARENQTKAALISGVLLLLAGCLNLYLVPHPLWFSSGTILSYIPFAFLGSKIGRRIKDNNVI